MTEKQALLLAGLTSLTWGLTGIFVRLLPTLSPLTITAGRLIIALVALLPLVLLIRNIRVCFKVTIRKPVAYILALLLAGYYLLATAAFQLAPVAEVALLLSTPPIFVLLLRKLRKDVVTLKETGGAILAVSGIALIMLPKMSLNGEMSTSQLTGDILAVSAAVLTAVYAYIYRCISERGKAPETAGVTILTFVVGGMILLFVLSILQIPVGLEMLTTNGWILLLGLGVISTAIPSLAFAMVSTRLPATITSTISLFIPVFAGIFAFLILDEGLSLLFIAGSILVLGGVAMLIHKRRIKTLA